MAGALKSLTNRHTLRLRSNRRAHSSARPRRAWPRLRREGGTYTPLICEASAVSALTLARATHEARGDADAVERGGERGQRPRGADDLQAARQERAARYRLPGEHLERLPIVARGQHGARGAAEVEDRGQRAVATRAPEL